jgi:hypothetical protein
MTVALAAVFLTAWAAAVAFLAAVFLDWTGSLFVSVPAALCVATGAGLLLAGPPRR